MEESPFHKATLVRGDNQREEGGDSRCKDFGNDFVDDVAKTNGAIISPSLGRVFFGMRTMLVAVMLRGKKAPLKNC